MLHNKFWQAFFALAPLIVFFIAIVGYLFFIFSVLGDLEAMESSQGNPSAAFFAGIGTFVLLIFLAVFISLASLIFYIMHAVQNTNLKENNLLLVWILLFIFVGGIGKLMYWILEILNKRKPANLSHLP
tara:strand:- start:806 stop:1192 length:387 start_codon:yes stop_codon:yes gene_type:complete